MEGIYLRIIIFTNTKIHFDCITPSASPSSFPPLLFLSPSLLSFPPFYFSYLYRLSLLSPHLSLSHFLVAPYFPYSVFLQFISFFPPFFIFVSLFFHPFLFMPVFFKLLDILFLSVFFLSLFSLSSLFYLLLWSFVYCHFVFFHLSSSLSFCFLLLIVPTFFPVLFVLFLHFLLFFLLRGSDTHKYKDCKLHSVDKLYTQPSLPRQLDSLCNKANCERH